MTLLQKALSLWLRAGHTQADFRRITGMDTGSTSRIFNGERGLSIDQRARVIRAFQADGSLPEALALVVADLRDTIPAEAVDHIRVLIDTPVKTEEAHIKQSRVAAAKAEFQRALDIDDPDTIDLVLSLYDWRHPKKKHP